MFIIRPGSTLFFAWSHVYDVDFYLLSPNCYKYTKLGCHLVPKFPKIAILDEDAINCPFDQNFGCYKNQNLWECKPNENAETPQLYVVINGLFMISLNLLSM